MEKKGFPKNPNSISQSTTIVTRGSVVSMASFTRTNTSTTSAGLATAAKSPPPSRKFFSQRNWSFFHMTGKKIDFFLVKSARSPLLFAAHNHRGESKNFSSWFTRFALLMLVGAWFSYMAVKNHKLHFLFDAGASSSTRS